MKDETPSIPAERSDSIEATGSERSTQQSAAPATPERTRNDPRTLEQFVVAAYSNPTRKPILKPKSAVTIAGELSISEAARMSLASNLLEAQALAVSIELLLILIDLKGPPSLRTALLEAVGRVLRAQPSFSSFPELSAVLANEPDALPPRAALKLLAINKISDSKRTNARKRHKTTSISAETAQVICCLALWFHLTRDYSLDQLTRDLDTVFWSERLPLQARDSQRVRALVSKPTIETVALVAQTYRSLADERQLIASEARRDEITARARVESLSRRAEELVEAIAHRDAKIRGLDAALAEAQATHAVELSHANDDRARISGRLVRVLREESRLLAEGLHALRRDPPKTAVMDDHAERVLSALKKALEELEGN
jgi:hypothetical protein